MVRNRIRMLRKEEGYSQKELGEILGVGQTAVSAWEIGRNEPDNEASHKMATLLGCSIGYLMGYESESETRGLSQAEWDRFQHQKRIKQQEIKEIEQIEGRENDELRRLIEEEEKASIAEEWEASRKEIFDETKEIDALLDGLGREKRKKAVKMFKLAKEIFEQ